MARTGRTVATRTFHLPDLGEGLAEAEVLEWKVAVGDTVEHDQVVVEVETAKSVVTLPSPYAGTVSALHCGTGEVVPVGAPLFTVAPEADAGAKVSAADTAAKVLEAGAGVKVLEAGAGAQAPEADTAADSGAVLTGYGTGAAKGWSRAGGSPADTGVRVPLDASADKFVRGHRDTPSVTIWADADATGLLAARTSLGTGLLPLLARACLAGLAAFPELNARVDTERGEIVHPPRVHLGIAAQTAQGLIVPVVRDADRLSPDDLPAELRRLTALARRGTLPVEHRTGGTFTLNNYGVLGVDGATPILNHPQAAMLGVGRVVERPWVVDGRVEVREVVHVSLTFDHRVCDGGTAAGFLRQVVAGITAPEGGTV
ncbi:dihydrolipoamide acetyltransferase family protein [Streptomyces sp. YU58]|uniref:dihydrolipoamide acetyltransferase family protein n=1 Tax=Streptomyces sp. SX92 TaxID=3158972 RepID=UPI0027BA5930|nr:dihydrolipoamide acetyltransferase family protein [Streptomyces coralus]WLW58752.1 dihydrolipoamide acetyltransferase family protein [Streptomyces coralus]